MWKRFVNSTFVRNSAVLMSGNILGQAISLLFHLLLCRIYSPDDFGAFAVFMSYAGFMTIIATGGYHYAILLPDDDRTLGNVMKLCMCCVATTSILSLLLLMPAEIFLLPGYYDNGTADMFWLLPVYVASYGVWKIMEYWHVRQSNYRLLSAYQLSQNLASSVIKSALWQMRSGIGLALGSVLGQITATVLCAAKNKKPLQILLSPYKSYELRKAARRYASFPKFSLARDGINYIASNSVYLVLAPFFGTYELGLFMMAATLSLRPLVLVNNAIGHNIMQSIADKLKTGQAILPAIKKYLATSTAVMLPSFTALFFIVKPLCVLLLGQEWEMSGTYLQYMLPWLCALAIFSPMANIPDLLQKQKNDMFFEITSIIIRIAMLAIGIAAGSFNVAITAYCAGALTVTTLRGLWYVKIAAYYDKKTIGN